MEINLQEEKMLEILKKIKGNKDFSNSKISDLGGLSNYIYKIEFNDKEEILVKQFSNYFECFLNRERENKIVIELSKNNLHPEILYFDNQMRIEQYLKFAKITSKQMWENPIFKKIALKLAIIHEVGKNYLEINEKTLIEKIFDKNIQESIIKKISISKIDLQNKEEIIKIVSSLFENSNLKTIFEKYKNSQTIFCHNDLNNTNFLFDKENDNLILLDYEYCGKNFLGFEFGNLFNEMCTNYELEEAPFFKFCFENDPMNSNFHQEFLLNYFVAKHLLRKDKVHKEIFNTLDTLNYKELIEFIRSEDEILLKNILFEIDQVVKEILDLRIFSHVFWLLIAALSLDISKDFDFFEYIKEREKLIMQLLSK